MVSNPFADGERRTRTTSVPRADASAAAASASQQPAATASSAEPVARSSAMMTHAHRASASGNVVSLRSGSQGGNDARQWQLQEDQLRQWERIQAQLPTQQQQQQPSGAPSPGRRSDPSTRARTLSSSGRGVAQPKAGADAARRSRGPMVVDMSRRSARQSAHYMALAGASPTLASAPFPAPMQDATARHGNRPGPIPIPAASNASSHSASSGERSPGLKSGTRRYYGGVKSAHQDASSPTMPLLSTSPVEDSFGNDAASSNYHSDHTHSTFSSSNEKQRYLAPPSPALSTHSARFAHATSFTTGAIRLDAEDDDHLHDPRVKDRINNHAVSFRGCLNITSLVGLILTLVTLFAGYPIIDGIGLLSRKPVHIGVNATGQVAKLPLPQLVDPDTPTRARTWTSPDSVKYNLVFSDEFNQDGRTFGKGEDPWWEAVDLWYSGTQDYEWYSPENIYTKNGSLEIVIEEKESHNLNFQSGMLQSWNKVCFSGGYIEFNAMLPGSVYTQGFWPGLWTMGNLGRPGYPGSNDGLWPYSYSGCDTGMLPKQVRTDGSGPYDALNSQGLWAAKDGHISELPGMRFPSCTCPGEDHPGPNVNVARSAPELDVLEAQVTPRGAPYQGEASQSMQLAPFNRDYHFNHSGAEVYDASVSEFNNYEGGVYQQAISAVTRIPSQGYELAENPRYVTFGMEYEPDWDLNGGGFVRWYVAGKPSWKMDGTSIGPDKRMEVSQRHVTVEPMAIIINLAIAEGFESPLWDNLPFPAHFRIDYVRVYQKEGEPASRLSCSPPDYPTAEYIKSHPDLYYNNNLTSYKMSKHAWPKNKLTGCKATK